MLTRYAQRNLVWIDCVSPSPIEIRSLMHEFALDPSLGQELLLPSYKAKVQRYGDALYVILHFPVLRGIHQQPEQEIDFVIGKHFLITTRYENIDPLHMFAKAFEVEAVLGTDASRMHGGHLFVAMANNLYQALIDECDSVHRRLRDIEEHIFSGDERRMVAELSQVGRVIHDFRQALAPHEEMLRSFETASMRFFGVEFSHHVSAASSSYHRVERTLENLRDSLGELRETNNSLLSTKQNEIMKTLTVVAFFFLPLSFIAGLFGMNTVNNPIIGSTYDFWTIFGGMFVIAFICLIYFKRKGWL